MHWYTYLVTILLSAFTGWMTTWIALKLLFNPRKPYNIFGFKLQGIFPKNQAKIAKRLGDLVGTELLPFSDIEAKIMSDENLQKLKPQIEAHIDQFLNHKLRDVFPILSKFIGVKTTNQLKESYMTELEAMFPILINQYMTHLKKDINIEAFVAEKVQGFSSEKLEKIIRYRELKMLEVIGAVFGAFLGVLQVVFNMMVHT